MPYRQHALSPLGIALFFASAFTGCMPSYYQTGGYYSPTGTSPTFATTPSLPPTAMSVPSGTAVSFAPQPAVTAAPNGAVALNPVPMNAGLPSIPAHPGMPIPATSPLPPSSPYPATASLTPVPMTSTPESTASVTPKGPSHVHNHPHPHTPPVPQSSSPPPSAPPAFPQPSPVPSTTARPIPSMAAGNLPGDIPARPNGNWTPWPMPTPSSNALSAIPRNPNPMFHTADSRGRGRHRHLSVATRPGSPAERVTREEASLTTAAAFAASEAARTQEDDAFAKPVIAGETADDPFAGLPPVTAQADLPAVDSGSKESRKKLRYRGGKVLRDLAYVNLYISGDEGWNMSDVAEIDRALAAAMNDEQLNNVVRQYFDNQPVTTTVHPSHPLTGPVPQQVSRGDVHIFLEHLYQEGKLADFDLNVTVFNFICPPGTILTDSDRPTLAENGGDPASGEELPEVNSRNGLGGYHGSIHIGNETLYYTVSAFSEQRPDGFKNGIAAFPEGWKNTVATLYHQLQEVRTNPDVEDVIRDPKNPEISSKLGWTSDDGEEVGDAPLLDAVIISEVIKEVPLSDGSGTVPIQLIYSNAANGPEGPIPDLHPLPAE